MSSASESNVHVYVEYQGCSSGEQHILEMFWVPHQEDAIQQTHLLTKAMRMRSDPWLKCVLEADRFGRESWEMYCFSHGYPTRNVGSWLPDRALPACGNGRCAALATKDWPAMWREAGNFVENWMQRKGMECDHCKKERVRRRVVLQQEDEVDMERFQSPPFSTAPYVHPFRHPSYFATHVRALHMAKVENRRLSWCVAFDKPKGGSLQGGTMEAEKRKERWLELHDRNTGGIPGLLPLVLDMPVRFSDAVDKDARVQGVFKHTRGILRGWDLDETEAHRGSCEQTWYSIWSENSVSHHGVSA